MTEALRFGILTLSDRAASGERADVSGPALAERIRTNGWLVLQQAVIPDEYEAIASTLRQWADEGSLDVILTTGGTGFGLRDVTPEATLAVVQRAAPGLAEAMRQASLRINPNAMLSRAAAGIRGQTLIINLPGSPKGALENLAVVLPVLAHAAHLLRGDPAAEGGHPPPASHPDGEAHGPSV